MCITQLLCDCNKNNSVFPAQPTREVTDLGKTLKLSPAKSVISVYSDSTSHTRASSDHGYDSCDEPITITKPDNRSLLPADIGLKQLPCRTNNDQTVALPKRIIRHEEVRRRSFNSRADVTVTPTTSSTKLMVRKEVCAALIPSLQTSKIKL